MRSKYFEVGIPGRFANNRPHRPNKTRVDDFPKDLNDTFNQIWLDLDKEIALLSTNSTHIIIEDSDHFIQLQRPDVVIDAILTMIAEVRK